MKKTQLVFYVFTTGFLLNLVWENAQSSPYDGYTNFWKHFLICFWASLVDAVVVLLLYGLLVGWDKDFYWAQSINLKSVAVLVLLGGATAIGFEQWVFSNGVWDYTNRIPVVLLGTCLMPLLQMMLLPPLSYYVFRMILKYRLESEKKELNI